MSKFEESSSEDGWDYESSSGEDGEMSTYGKGMQPAVDMGDNIPQIEMDDEAPINYNTVRFKFNVVWTAADLIDDKGALKYDGKIPLSVMNDKLTLDEHNPEDFKIRTDTPTKADLDAKHGKKGKKGKKEKRRHVHRDLLKNVRLVDITTNWDHDLGVELPGVSAIGKEGWYNRSPVVSKTFAARTFSATKPESRAVLTRRVTKGMVVFNNRYGGQTWETYKQEFEPYRSTVGIPFNSPWRMYHNQKYQATPLNKPTEGFEKKNMLEVTHQLEAEISAIAEKDMKSKLSLGDVTNNFCMNLFVPTQSGSRIKQHREFVATGNGKQWKNFADEYAALSHQLLSAKPTEAKALIADFKNTAYFFRGYVEADYLHCKGQKIAMNTKK